MEALHDVALVRSSRRLMRSQPSNDATLAHNRLNANPEMGIQGRLLVRDAGARGEGRDSGKLQSP